MEKIKEFFSDKGTGFYVTLAGVLLSLVTAIVYAVSYGSTRFMNWAGFVFLLAGAILAIVLIVIKQVNWAPAAVALGSFLGLLFFIYGIYFYVSVVMVGIQANAFDPSFFACVILFALSLVAGIVSVFMKQDRE